PIRLGHGVSATRSHSRIDDPRARAAAGDLGRPKSRWGRERGGHPRRWARFTAARIVQRRRSTIAERSTWRVVEARFEVSAASLDQCPPGDLPEVAIAGRSNVGKSSLVNALAHHKGLARVSRTPGRTQLINFFTLRVRNPDGET